MEGGASPLWGGGLCPLRSDIGARVGASAGAAAAAVWKPIDAAAALPPAATLADAHAAAAVVFDL